MKLKDLSSAYHSFDSDKIDDFLAQFADRSALLRYFIDKFNAIPDSLWTTLYFTQRTVTGKLHCALGHCGMCDAGTPPEAHALMALFIDCANRHEEEDPEKHSCVTRCNDQYAARGFSTPRQSIVAQLQKWLVDEASNQQPA